MRNLLCLSITLSRNNFDEIWYGDNQPPQEGQRLFI